MSLPSFPNVDPPIQREDAVNQILSSIAMEELGLSHILNAEGEKMQYILGTLPGLSGPAATVEDVLNANESVRGLLETAVQNQIFLKGRAGEEGSPAPCPRYFMRLHADRFRLEPNCRFRHWIYHIPKPVGRPSLTGGVSGEL